MSLLPVCVRTCLLRSKVSLKPFPQKSHKCLFCSLWHFKCRFSMRWNWNTFWHTWQTYVAPPDCTVSDFATGGEQCVAMETGGFVVTLGTTGGASAGSSPIVTCSDTTNKEGNKRMKLAAESTFKLVKWYEYKQCVKTNQLCTTLAQWLNGRIWLLTAAVTRS